MAGKQALELKASLVVFLALVDLELDIVTVISLAIFRKDLTEPNTLLIEK